MAPWGAGACWAAGGGGSGTEFVTLLRPALPDKSVSKSEVAAKVAASQPVSRFMKLVPVGVASISPPPPPNIESPAPRPA